MDDIFSLLKLKQQKELLSPELDPSLIQNEMPSQEEIKSDLKPEPKMPKMQLPKLDLNQMIEREIKDSQLPSDEELLNNRLNQLQMENQPEIPVQNKYQELLNQYSSLKSPTDLARLQSEGTRDANLFGAGAKIAQGLAMQSGAKIDDAQDLVKNLKDQSQQLPKDMKESVQLNNEMQMNDPNSDISKFARQQAVNVMMRMNPKMSKEEIEKLNSQFSSMTAKQLEDLGFKGVSQQSGKLYTTLNSVLSENGLPVMKNDITGEMYEVGNTNTPYKGPLKALYPKVINDLYGNPTLVDTIQKTPIPVFGGAKGQASTPNQEVKLKNIWESGEDYRKSFDTMKKDSFEDLKMVRDTAAASLTLDSKLSDNNPDTPEIDVDSGTLGTIQAQSAIMSGQKGALSDADLNKFAGAGGAEAKLKRIALTGITGEMTQDDIKFFKRLNELFKGSAAKILDDRSQYHIESAKALLQAKFPNISDDNVKSLLGLKSISKVIQGDKNKTEQNDLKKSDQSGMVKMISPSGKSMLIPKENVEAAKKRGAKVVE